jgi:hypothetical protein
MLCRDPVSSRRSTRELLNDGSESESLAFERAALDATGGILWSNEINCPASAQVAPSMDKDGILYVPCQSSVWGFQQASNG